MSFKQLGISEPIIRALNLKGYTDATPIQKNCIPEIFAGKDMVASAQTGTGKTGAFTLPLIQRLNKYGPLEPKKVRSIILVPTRELAIQVHENISQYSQFLSIKAGVAFGGQPLAQQIKALEKGVHVLVVTPGRLMDLQKRKAIELDQVDVIVLDEADRLLELGFQAQLGTILAQLPKIRQTLMFSATYGAKIKKLSEQWLNNEVRINTKAQNTVADNVTQKAILCDKERKFELTAHLIKKNNWSQVLVFVRTKAGADELADYLYDHKHGVSLSAASIHSDKTQAKRTSILKKFKEGKIQVLVATDVAARGLDIKDLPAVINVNLPFVKEDYVHRIGRTGRAEAKGEAYTLISADESELLDKIEVLLQKVVERETIVEFRPRQPVAPTRLRLKYQPRDRTKKPGVRKSKGATSKKDLAANNPYLMGLSKRARKAVR
ncbi:DEAD/DEAH box helicase [Marinicellulosiphila megalodicopiae]|uniref:DEAD/DEAH box helicase n=1 Tax=Marinicellulosiphila megalodicopiae TaxID=2724896 RepID=UPI003BAFA33C